MSPDYNKSGDDPEPVPYADLENPQSLNLYEYAGNNPLIHIDADGHCWPEFLCNFFTEVKNKVLHGEFTTDTAGAKIHQLVREDAQNRARSQYMEQLKSHPPEIRYGVVFTPFTSQFLGQLGERTTYLYEKVGPNGEHLKYGITSNDPSKRYSASELKGGRLKTLAKGSRSDMLKMERDLHETMPIGPEEGQSFYEGIQEGKGLSTPPYDPLP